MRRWRTGPRCSTGRLLIGVKTPSCLSAGMTSGPPPPPPKGVPASAQYSPQVIIAENLPHMALRLSQWRGNHRAHAAPAAFAAKAGDRLPKVQHGDFTAGPLCQFEGVHLLEVP